MIAGADVTSFRLASATLLNTTNLKQGCFSRIPANFSLIQPFVLYLPFSVWILAAIKQRKSLRKTPPRKNSAMRKRIRIATVILFQALLCLVARAEVRFEVSFDRAVQSEPITGRVILIIARSERPEPRLQIGPNATPIFGVDAENLSPGQVAVIDQTTFGHPVDSLLQLPAGDYYVQAMLNVYTKCQRSDGRTVESPLRLAGDSLRKRRRLARTGWS
jgi:hypothetical protein